MIRNDNSKYLLFMEPNASEQLKTPIDDSLTSLMEMALSKAKTGISFYSDLNDSGDFHIFKYKDIEKKIPSFCTNSSYRGTHSTECGKHSSSTDYLLENGMITNSLAVFYVKWYRNSISENDFKKLEDLYNFYLNHLITSDGQEVNLQIKMKGTFHKKYNI